MRKTFVDFDDHGPRLSRMGPVKVEWRHPEVENAR